MAYPGQVGFGVIQRLLHLLMVAYHPLGVGAVGIFGGNAQIGQGGLGVELGDNIGAAGHRQLIGTQGGKGALGIDIKGGNHDRLLRGDDSL